MYIYIETNLPRQPGDTARLESPWMRGPQCMTFYYHMFGSKMMSCVVMYIKSRATNRLKPVWLKSLNRGNRWIQRQISINETKSYQVSWEMSSKPLRRPKNIKEILARPRKINVNDNDSDKHGCFKCKSKCDLCRNFLVESDHFSSASSNRTYRITQHLHCKSKNVIYLVTCTKCSVQYVGSTSNEFKVRFRNHKSAMTTNKNTCEVATHFKETFHILSDFNFTIIEQISNPSDNNSIDERLLTREAYWSAQLCTLQPYGLNKRSEFNSRNRIRYN